MSPRGKRTTLATGVYADASGITVRVQKGSGATKVILESPRFPLGTPLEELRHARRDLKDKLGSTASDHQQGALGEAFDSYLDTFPKTSPRRRDEAALLEHWRAAGFAVKAMNGVTALEIRQQLATWHGRFQPATINHLRRVLGAVYRAVNGKSGFNPVRDVPKLTVRYEEPRAIPYDLIEYIFSHIPDLGRPLFGQPRSTINKAKIRLRVMAYTGLPPAQLARMEPRDLHLRAKALFARPRRKGAGVHGYTIKLTDAGVRELQQFVQHGCFGPFTARRLARTWARAIVRAKQTWAKQKRGAWPLADDARPYDLRHSYGTILQEQTGDLQATADMLMHASLSTTRRYTKGAVTPRMSAAVEKLNAAFGTMRGHAPDEKHTKTHANTQKHGSRRNRREPEKIRRIR